MKAYDDKISLIEKMIEVEKIPTGNPKALATITFLTAEWGAGDALAGWILEGIIRENREAVEKFTEKILGTAKPSLAGLLLCLKELSKRHKTFAALDRFGATGNPKYLYEVARELGVEVEE